MDENENIRSAIRLLAKHRYRTASAVMGEYIEKRVAEAFEGKLAGVCQKGFDLVSKRFGKVEVKSRNYDGKSMQCNLTQAKIDSIDNFVLVVVKEGAIDKALLFSREVLLPLRSKSGMVTINRPRFGLGEDVTEIVKDVCWSSPDLPVDMVCDAYEKASALLSRWGDIFKKYNFGLDSSLKDYDGLLALIERFGGFDFDDPEAQLYGNEEVFDEVKKIMVSKMG